MTQDEIICRFCLDSRNTKSDPLITPCECKGSIRYIHTLCLRHWRLLNPARNGIICLLCFNPYILQNDDIIEIIPDESSLPIFLLRYPVALFCLVNYFAVLHYTLIPMKLQSVILFEIYEYLFQLLYFFIFAILWKVKDKRRYVRLFVSKSLLACIAVQIISNIYIHHHDFITGTVALNFTLSYYWQKHRETLETINNR